ncbi:MAG: hypothetical protein JWO60_2367, partial [Frankiales bacterium]|nr:hypothetical protein [Frankiales bacterium]
GTTTRGGAGAVGRAPGGAGAPGTTPTSVGAAAGTSRVPSKGRGWDEKFVYIGVATQKDAERAFAAAGAKGLQTGNQEAAALAVAAEVNRQGGILGRQVKLVFKDQQTVATAQDPNTAGAAACTYFSQDKPVIALINPVTLMDVPSFRACMAKARVPLFSASVAGVDKKVGDDLAPYFYQSVAPTWDTLAPVLAARLKAQGYFTGWDPRVGAKGAGPVKVGVLTDTTDVGWRVGVLVSKALQGAGQGRPVVFAASGDFSGAVLQFAGNGVTHVISTNSDLVAFQISAASQNYRPRYGIHTLNAPVSFLEGASPRGQNSGAMGVGWSPSFDVNDSNDADTAGERECDALFAKAGQSFQGKRLAETVAFAFCDAIRLVAASAKSGGGFTGTQLFDGVSRSGSGLRVAFAFGNGLSPSTLFLPGAARDLQWFDACSCLRYVGPATTPFNRR